MDWFGEEEAFLKRGDRFSVAQFQAGLPDLIWLDAKIIKGLPLTGMVKHDYLLSDTGVQGCVG